MNQLSKEAIKAIQAVVEVVFPLEDNENWDEVMNEQGRISFIDGAKYALTNSNVFQLADLMSLEECVAFSDFLSGYRKMVGNMRLSGEEMVEKSTTELLTIFRNAK